MKTAHLTRLAHAQGGAARVCSSASVAGLGVTLVALVLASAALAIPGNAGATDETRNDQADLGKGGRVARTLLREIGNAIAPPDWIFRARVLMTGSSDESEPAGFKVFSTFPIEVGVGRRLGDRFGIELDARTESREVNRDEGTGEDTRLGSIELLPAYLLLQFQPRLGDRIQPILGAGVNLTVCWEKTGALDSDDLTPSFGPTVQLGADYLVSGSTVLNLDLRWNYFRTDLESGGVKVATLKLDTASIGVGVGFRF